MQAGRLRYAPAEVLVEDKSVFLAPRNFILKALWANPRAPPPAITR